MTDPRPPLRRTRALACLLGAAAAATLLAPATAWAHGDPTLFSVLRDVRPALPDGVALGVRRAELTQLVLRNPTPTPVEVLDPSGTPFLRVSAAGAEGDVASPFLRGVPLDVPVAPAPPRWERLTTASAWAWPDPRIDPPLLPDPDQPVGGNRARVDLASRETQVLSGWTVGLRRDGVAHTATGVVERRPYLGRTGMRVTATPPGVTASVVEGPNPALRLEVPAGSRVDVRGADGEVVLRMGPDGSWIRTDSAEYALHRETLRVDPGGAAWVPIGGPTRVTWVDPRLRRRGGPPPDARTRTEPVQLARWAVPVVVDGVAGEVAGAELWLPAPPAAVPAPAGGPTAATAVLLGVAVALTAGGGLAYRAAARGRRAGAASEAAGRGPRPDGAPEPVLVTGDGSR